MVPTPAIFSINTWLKDNWLALSIAVSCLIFVWDTSARAATLESKVAQMQQRTQKIDEMHHRLIRVEEMLVFLKEKVR